MQSTISYFLWWYFILYLSLSALFLMLLSAITNLLVSMDCLACLPFRSLLSLKRIEILQATVLAGIAFNKGFLIHEIHGIPSEMFSFFLTIALFSISSLSNSCGRLYFYKNALQVYKFVFNILTCLV